MAEGPHPDANESEVNVAFLAAAYEQVANRDSSLIQTTFTVVGIAATAVGGIVFAVPDYVGAATMRPDGDPAWVTIPWFYLTLPLVPTILFGLLTFLTFHINLSAQYSHALEAHMARVSGSRFSSKELRSPGLSVEFPSFLRLTSRIFGAGRTKHTRTYRASLFAILATVGVLLLAVPVIKLRDLASEFQLLALALYLPPNMLLGAALLRSWRPHRGLLRDTMLDVLNDVSPRREGRSLWSYILVPRTVDHFFKLLVAGSGALLGRLALASRYDEPMWSVETAATVGIVILVLEYLMYQGPTHGTTYATSLTIITTLTPNSDAGSPCRWDVGNYGCSGSRFL